jgi:hypothetical protein
VQVGKHGLNRQLTDNAIGNAVGGSDGVTESQSVVPDLSQK